MRKWLVMWLASLIFVAGFASALTRAQTRSSEPQILSGADLGFRVDAVKADGPVGTLMVKVNGKWVEAGFSLKMSRAH